MAKITLGHPEAHEKLTGKLLWKRVTSTGYHDAGNVRDYVDASTRSLVVRSRAQQGARHVNDEQADVNHECYTFLLDERVPAQEELIKLASSLADRSQPAAEGATATIESVERGKWFPTGAYNIANVNVTASASGVMEEGTDYQVDAQNGRIYVEPAGGIGDGETLNLTFDEPAITIERGDSQQKALAYVDVVIEEHNQYSKMWLRRMAFRGYMNVTEFPSQTGEFGTYRVKVTPSGPVTTEKRPEHTAISDYRVATPGNSSSSSDSSASSASSGSSSETAVNVSSQSSSSSSSQSSASSQSSSSKSSTSSYSSSSSHSLSSSSSPTSQSSNSSSSTSSTSSETPENESSSSSSSTNSSSSTSSLTSGGLTSDGHSAPLSSE